MIYPYQLRTVDALVNGEAVYLAAEQGLGKTLMAFAVAKRLNAKRILFLCPATVKIPTIAELGKWWPEAKYHMPTKHADIGTFKTRAPLVVIVNYDKLSRGNLFLSELIKMGPWDLIIADEAHALKDLKSKRTQAVYQHLAPHALRVLPMSGTPMPNHAGEIYASLRALAPERIMRAQRDRPMTQFEFENHYCSVDMRRIGARQVRQITGSRNIPELRERLKGFFLRLTKAQCLPDLPPLQFVQLPLGVAVRDDMSDINEMIPAGLSDEELLTYLRGRHEHFASALRMIGLAKAASAVEYLNDILSDNKLQVVVWARHHDTIDYLKKGLENKGLSVVKIDGRSDDKQRLAAVQEFLDPSRKVRVFIGQINAAGTGLTLLTPTVQPRDVFFVETSFVPGDNLQAACRVHRIGQKDGVLVRYMVAQSIPLDVRVQEIVARKTSELAELL